MACLDQALERILGPGRTNLVWLAPQRGGTTSRHLTLEQTPRFTGRLMALRVSELADLAEVSSDTIRYYEKEGLLPRPSRSPSGYREFEAEIAGAASFHQRGAELWAQAVTPRTAAL